jgi:hypothetical protein
VPASAVAATVGAGLVAAVARLGDAALPVLRAAALAAAGSPLAAAGAGAAALSAGPGRTLALAAPA